MLYSLFGVLVIASSFKTTEETISTQSQYGLAIFVQMIVVVGIASIIICNRQLKTLHVSVIQFHLSVVGTVVAAMQLFFVKGNVFSYEEPLLTYGEMVMMGGGFYLATFFATIVS